MRNLKSLIAGIGFGALSILPSFGQSVETKKDTINQTNEYAENFFKVGVGNHIWDDGDITRAYGNLFMLKPEYSRLLTKTFSLDASLDLFFNKKDKDGGTDYKFSNFAADVGLGKYIISSKDGSIFIHTNIGIQYMLTSETISTPSYITYNQYGAPTGQVDPSTEKESGNGVGFYVGAGIELKVGPGTLLFGDVNITWNKVSLYGSDLDVGGTELSIGVEFY